jgi:hypothetical protein
MLDAMTVALIVIGVILVLGARRLHPRPGVPLK